MIAITGLTYLKQDLAEQEEGFTLWYRIHYPDLLDEGVERAFQQAQGIESWEPFKALTKREFLQDFMGIKGNTT